MAGAGYLMQLHGLARLFTMKCKFSGQSIMPTKLFHFIKNIAIIKNLDRNFLT